MDKIRLTTKDDDYPIIYRLLTIPGGFFAEFWTINSIKLHLTSQPLNFNSAPRQKLGVEHERQLSELRRQVVNTSRVGGEAGERKRWVK